MIRKCTARVRLILCAGVMLAAAGAAWPHDTALARSPEVYTGILSGMAVGGYDPVAYFLEGKPVEGRRDISLTWKGVTWRFANEKNRDAFKANPETYAPQYGGHCAWAVSRGYTAKGDPRYWKIVGGKLYLNYDARVQKDWERDIPGHIVNSDKNWPNVLGK
jgi:YHS domain-containing protein